MKKLYIIILLFVITSCSSDIKFNKEGWLKHDELEIYPNRNKMLNDLTKNYKIKGLSYTKLIELICEPEKNIKGDNNVLYYYITAKYGHDIDPVYTKTLQIEFGADSIVKDFKINEYKN